MIRILLVDDQNIVRQGIQALLEPKTEFEVVGTAEDGKSAIEQVKSLKPDVVLIDVEMPGMSGITATQKICQQFPQTKILVLSSHESHEYVTQALQAGAEGYLLKTTLAEDLEQAILSVCKGHLQIESRLLRGLLGRVSAAQLIAPIKAEQNGSISASKQLVKQGSLNKLDLDFDRGNISKIDVQENVIRPKIGLFPQIDETTIQIDETTIQSTSELSKSKTNEPPLDNYIETSDINNSLIKQDLKELPVQQYLNLTEQEQEPETKATKSKNKSPFKLLLPIGLLLAGIAGVTWYLAKPSNVVEPLEVSGRIEGYETNIGAKFAGRVNYIAVREGDRVKKGQVIVRMDDEEIQAQLRGADARIIAAQQAQEQARLQPNILASRIQEIQLNLQQAQGDAQGRVAQAEASVASSQAQLNEAQANLKQAKAESKLAAINRDRYAKLVKDGAINQQQFDQAQTDYEKAMATVTARQGSVESFRKLVQAAEGESQQAQTSTLNPNIRNTQIASLRTQLSQARNKLVAAQADVKNAKADRQEVQSQIKDLNIISPIDGVVVTRSSEPGAVVTTGKTLLTVINPDEVYLRGFIPEGEIGKVKVGQDANVFLDSAPEKPLKATINAIDTEASFTPENIYFKEDRVKQVFGVKIGIDRPDGSAKPGMPADAEIVTK
jgi:HlyD family secretion protein